ncbi:MAG: endo alpha-1,4 polygalactosaminidase [Bacillota bacterium]
MGIKILLLIMLTMNINLSDEVKVDDFMIYYGDQNKQIVKEFNNYDLLILETAFYSKEDIIKLKKENNSKYIGYLSVFEISNWDKELINKLNEDDYLVYKNKIIKNEKYENFVANIKSENYRDLLVRLIDKRIVKKQFDGVFLDTIDWIDYYKNEKVVEDMIYGYKLFLKEIKDKYPDLIIYQNRGFFSFNSFSSNFIDGIFWENFSYSKIYEDFDIFINLLKKDISSNISVFLIYSEDKKRNKIISKILNWPFMNKTKSYTEF